MDQGVIVVILALSLVQTLANPDAKRLYDDLLADYNRLIRPVSNHTDKVTVKLGLRLSQLVDLVKPSLRNNLGPML
jgi:nicotinic acetylcholine receptor